MGTGSVKTATLQNYLDRYQLDALVETGLDRGHGSGMGVRASRYVALDLDPANVDAACARGFDARCGDSGGLLPGVLAELDGPALFWLDAHGIDCHHGPGDAERFPGWAKVPLLRELQAVAEWEHGAASVVLVDDMPAMAEWVDIGLGEEAGFDQFLDGLPTRWGREQRDGILRLVPA